MYRIFFVSAAALLLGFAPLSATAAAIGEKPVAATNPSITFVDGWWEQEHHDDAPQHYWRLQREQRERYDRLQAQQAQREAQRRRFDDEDRRAIEEQHRLLGFQIIIH